MGPPLGCQSPALARRPRHARINIGQYRPTTVSTSVDWRAVIPMAVGCLIGGAISPSVTRHVPGHALRILAAPAGLALAVRLWIAA
jgi:uncharacterized membrane protein YfcA